MHQFIAKSVEGKIEPLTDFKKKLFIKLLKSYEKLNMSFKVTIEVVDKNINEAQKSLYRAFLVEASKHFGSSYQELESALIGFHPLDIDGNVKDISKWTTDDLNDFINKANALLLEADSDFKF